jgi:2-polyprenyl-3-methyl-5-hydroxy-6-metoxy-1,4-benzoquinol methylase
MKRVEPRADWSADTRHVYESDLVRWWDKRLEAHFYNAYHAFVESMAARVVRTGAQRVLNVGCAQATLDLVLAERGVEMTSLEIRDGFLEYAKQRWERGNITWLLGDFFQLEVPGAPFDFVMSHHVIEHVADPLRFVRKMARMVRRGGQVLVTTPNGEYVRSKLPTFATSGELRTGRDFANSKDGADHVYAFTMGELRGLFEDAGLKVIEAFTYESMAMAGHLKLRYMHRVLPARVFRTMESLSEVPVVGAKLFANQGVVAVKQ